MTEERDTAEYLATQLRLAAAPPTMIQRAEEGYYHDFRSPLATPIMQLVLDATEHGLGEIAERARQGDFDATKAESDAWAASEDGQATFRELLEGGPK